MNVRILGLFKQYVRQGGGGLLIFVTECDKGWVISFWSVMSHFLNTLIFITFCFIIANLALFQKKFGFTSKNNLEILF